MKSSHHLERHITAATTTTTSVQLGSITTVNRLHVRRQVPLLFMQATPTSRLMDNFLHMSTKRLTFINIELFNTLNSLRGLQYMIGLLNILIP